MSTQTEQGERPTAPSRANTEAPAPERRVGGWRRSRLDAWVPVAVGVLAAVVSAIGSGNASYWGDEAASVMSAQRSIPNLFALLGNIDAVHGSYYLFLHVWSNLVGTGEFAVRLPSAVAVGFAAAGTVVLGRRFGGTIGVVAGLVFAVLPQVTMMGQEARSYAFGMAAAVWLTAWLVDIVQRRRVTTRTWALYAVAVAACLYLFLYLALLALVHLVVLLAARPGRAVWRGWLRSLVLAAVLAAPVLYFGMAQRDQIGFLARRNYATAESALVGQWFTSPVFAAVAWLLMIAGVVFLARRDAASRRALAVLAAWAFAPTALLLIGNVLVTPMYNLRYVAFCTPAVALLMACGIVGVAASLRNARLRSAVPVVVMVLVAALAVPTYLAQRGPFGKDGGSDLRQVADAIRQHASPGDAVVFDEDVKPSQKPRLAIDLYPDRFAGLDDVALITPYAARDQLWDEVRDPAGWATQLTGHDRVWAVERAGRDLVDVVELESLGFTKRQIVHVNRSTVYEMVRATPAE